MTATIHPDAPLVIGLSVLYEDEPEGSSRTSPVLGAISRGDDRRSARAAARGVLRDLIRGLPTLAHARGDLEPEERRIA